MGGRVKTGVRRCLPEAGGCRPGFCLDGYARTLHEAMCRDQEAAGQAWEGRLSMETVVEGGPVAAREDEGGKG